MSIAVQDQQVVDLEADHPLGVGEAPVMAVEAEVEAELQRIVPEAFSVRCPQTAGWVVRRVLQARRYAERVKLWAELERRRAEHEEQRLLFLFEGQLRDWTQNQVAKLRGRRKSLALPGGTVGFRSVPSRVVVHDEELVLKWAKWACPTAVVVSERLLKTPLAEHIERTGEVPAGMEIAPAATTFFIR